MSSECERVYFEASEHHWNHECWPDLPCGWLGIHEEGGGGSDAWGETRGKVKGVSWEYTRREEGEKKHSDYCCVLLHSLLASGQGSWMFEGCFSHLRDRKSYEILPFIHFFWMKRAMFAEKAGAENLSERFGPGRLDKGVMGIIYWTWIFEQNNKHKIMNEFYTHRLYFWMSSDINEHSKCTLINLRPCFQCWESHDFWTKLCLFLSNFPKIRETNWTLVFAGGYAGAV